MKSPGVRFVVPIVLIGIVLLGASRNVDAQARVLISTSTATPQAKTSNGVIAFASDQTGHDEIYLMRPDGTGVSQLTSSSADDQAPSWSPDGKNIVFSSRRDGQGDLYVMNADGSGVKRLTFTADAEITPAWSPDGKTIAYMRQAYDSMADSLSDPDLYTMNADGSQQKQVLDATTLGVKIRPFVSWSPDSKRLAVSIQKSGKSDIYLVDVTSKNSMTRLTTADGANTFPAWSPDGLKIAFVAITGSSDVPQVSINVIKVDGTGQKQITAANELALMPAWSPDNKMIAFVVLDSAQKYSNIFVINADGTNQQQLTKGTDKVTSATWSPAKISLKLPLPTSVPKPTPSGSASGCPIATDKTFGYTPDNPINVGGGDFGGPPRERDYVNKLRGPKGEIVEMGAIGSMPRASDGVILDAVEVTYAGHPQPITLYMNEYAEQPFQVPVGFTCAPTGPTA